MVSPVTELSSALDRMPPQFCERQLSVDIVKRLTVKVKEMAKAVARLYEAWARSAPSRCEVTNAYGQRCSRPGRSQRDRHRVRRTHPSGQGRRRDVCANDLQERGAVKGVAIGRAEESRICRVRSAKCSHTHAQPEMPIRVASTTKTPRMRKRSPRKATMSESTAAHASARGQPGLRRFRCPDAHGGTVSSCRAETSQTEHASAHLRPRRRIAKRGNGRRQEDGQAEQGRAAAEEADGLAEPECAISRSGDVP